MSSRRWLGRLSATALLIAIASYFDGVASAGKATGGTQDQGPTATVWDGVYDRPRALRGESEYKEHCAACHRADLTGANAPALVGETFTSHWKGGNARNLYARIISTMPTDDPGSLSEATVLDILAYIFKNNGYPEGNDKLATAGAAGLIMITDRKP